jgi:hypothetical protein
MKDSPTCSVPSSGFRFMRTGIIWVILVVWSALNALAQNQATVLIKRHPPWNLFNTTEPVRFDAELRNAADARIEIESILKDATGREVMRKATQVELAAGAAAAFVVDLGYPGRGYYELSVTARAAGQGSSAQLANAHCSLGVMEFVDRSAAELRDHGYVFGLKWWNGIQNLREMEAAMTKLGLQWTRIIQNESDKGVNRMTSAQILTEYPMNAVIKVERFPKEMYDADRYGSMEEWEAKYGRGSWALKSLPRKEPYQKWLKEQLAALPREQQVFEIWNEAWDKLPPGDFATLCQWIVEAIRADRPDAIVGPNLYGSTSPYDFDARVIQAGGLKGMKMVTLHPYGKSEDRAWLRAYRQWLHEQLGHEVDIYITEYGSHSTPEGPARRSELEQARRTVRQSLALYAEGVKALIPHWAGQLENNRTYIEDWFGFVRRNEEPKPVLLAHANSARLIDGSRYVGDLWFGPKVEAMLFEKNGIHTLVLWTLGDDPAQSDVRPPAREIAVKPGAKDITVVNMLGRESHPTLDGDTLHLTLDEAPLYLVGVGADLVREASRTLRADRWPQRERSPRTVRKMGKLEAAPTIDGDFSDWRGALELALVNPRVNGDDCSGIGHLGWDERNLYVGVTVRDNELLNTEIRKYLYRQDGMELGLSTEPRDSGGGFGPRDHHFFIVPTSGEGKPILGEVIDREAGVVQDLAGARFAAVRTAQGWAIEAAIPWSAFKEFKPAKGARLALEITLNDADTSHERFKVTAADASADFKIADPSTWSLLVLE